MFLCHFKLLNTYYCFCCNVLFAVFESEIMVLKSFVRVISIELIFFNVWVIINVVCAVTVALIFYTNLTLSTVDNLRWSLSKNIESS